MASVFDIEPQIVLLCEVQSPLHMLCSSGIHNVGGHIPQRAPFLSGKGITRKACAIGVYGSAAAVRPKWIWNCNRVGGVIFRVNPFLAQSLAGRFIVVGLIWIADRARWYCLDQITGDCFVEGGPLGISRPAGLGGYLSLGEYSGVVVKSEVKLLTHLHCWLEAITPCASSHKSEKERPRILEKRSSRSWVVNWMGWAPEDDDLTALLYECAYMWILMGVFVFTFQMYCFCLAWPLDHSA